MPKTTGEGVGFGVPPAGTAPPSEVQTAQGQKPLSAFGQSAQDVLAQSQDTQRRRPIAAPNAETINSIETIASAMWDLVAANRILAQYNLIDGEGHVSVRHPKNPDTYLMGTFEPPQLVTLENLIELDLDSRPMDARGRPLEGERFIHGGIYQARPDVQAVVHFHDPWCVLMANSGRELMPLYHDAGFIGNGIPLFEIRDFAGDDTALLIGSLALGRSLAQVLGDKPGILMRGHGATVTGNSLVEATARALYMTRNCRLQGQMLGRNVKLKTLSRGEVAKTTHHGFNHAGGFGKNWAVWEGITMSDYRPDSGDAT